MGGPKGTYTHGMDVAAVRDIADRLALAHRDLLAATQTSDTAMQTLRRHWGGEDRDKLFSKWPTMKSQLDTQAEDIGSLVRTVRAQAREQDHVSSAGGSNGPGGPGEGPGGHPGGSDHGDDPANSEDDSPWETKGPGGSVKVDADDPNPDRDHEDVGPRHRDDSDSTREDTRYRNSEGEDWERGSTHERTWGNRPGDHAEGDHKGDSRVDASVRVAGAERELWNEEKYGHTFGDEDGNHVRVEAFGTEGKVGGEATIGKDGLALAGTATAGAYAASVSGKYANSYGTSAQGRAYAGAEANVNAGLSLGADGLKASAGGEAFVGAKAEGSINQDLGPVDVGVGGEISYGLGAHAEADAEFSSDHVGVSVDIGATLGIGGGVEFDIGFDPPW